MSYASDLTIVPSFTFHQSEIGDADWEQPINVLFFNGTITLEQVDHSININSGNFEALVKAIRKCLPEATLVLNERYNKKQTNQ